MILKKRSLVFYDIEEAEAHEVDKKKLRKYEKKLARKLSRARMKNEIKKMNKEGDINV